MKYIRWIIFGIAALLVIFLVWGTAIEPYMLDVEEEIARIPNLPDAWVGRRVAVIGDLQVGMWLDNTSTVSQAADRIVEEEPAFILIIGDFIYHPVQDPDEEMQRAADLIHLIAESDIPTFAVLGNHDYAMSGEQDSISEESAERVKNVLEAMGVDVLQNEAVPLSIIQNKASLSSAGEADVLYVVGLGAEYPDNAKPQNTLSSVPDNAPRFVMMHHPDSFAEIPANSAPVAVAGHTHGGQIRIPGFPEWSWLTFAREDQVHADGWIPDYGEPGNRLYVNRGIGFSMVPIRFNAPPEVTIFVLERAE